MFTSTTERVPNLRIIGMQRNKAEKAEAKRIIGEQEASLRTANARSMHYLRIRSH
jgi:hypothetical protein